jgi:hypothetical protein
MTTSSDICAAIVAVLCDAVPAFNGRVLQTRTTPPLRQPDMPAALVYSHDETKTIKTWTPHDQAWTVAGTIAVAVFTLGADTVQAEAALDLLIGKSVKAILESYSLLNPETSDPAHPVGIIERIDSLRITRQVKLESDDATGEAMLAFDMAWSEIYAVPYPAPITEIDTQITHKDDVTKILVEFHTPLPQL